MDKNEIRALAVKFTELWNSDDETQVRSLYDEDAVLYQAPAKQALRGVEHILARWRAFMQIGPAHMALREVHVDGDTAVLEITVTGKNTGRFLDHEPTERDIELDTCLILQYRDGKIIKHTTYLDTATVLRSLGLLTIEGARPEAA